MSRNQNTFDTKVDPSGREIWKGDSPVLFLLVNMRLEGEAKDAITLPEISFVIFTLVLERNLGVQAKEWRQEWRIAVDGSGSDWRGRSKISHLREGNRCRGTIIKKDRVREVGGVLWRERVTERERDVHDHAQGEHVGDWIEAFNSCTGRVLFFEVGIVITK
jgi:hypothetical protein